MVGYAPQIHEVSKRENPTTVSIDFTSSLDGTDTLTGTPTVDKDDTLTVSDQAVNTAALEVNGATVAIGKAVQFRVDPSLAAAGRYTLRVLCATVAGDKKEGHVVLQVTL